MSLGKALNVDLGEVDKPRKKKKKKVKEGAKEEPSSMEESEEDEKEEVTANPPDLRLKHINHFLYLIVYRPVLNSSKINFRISFDNFLKVFRKFSKLKSNTDKFNLGQVLYQASKCRTFSSPYIF